MVEYLGIAPGLAEQQKEGRQEATAKGGEKALDTQEEKPAFVATNT